ncbi:unnamed protein product [marine sediment metagenome]|uniref:Uncharacterized protein n=1 Tax=marine sediment metagenome TaxID=412755 RepID=X1AMM6_9ZZZZ
MGKIYVDREDAHVAYRVPVERLKNLNERQRMVLVAALRDILPPDEAQAVLDRTYFALRGMLAPSNGSIPS